MSGDTTPEAPTATLYNTPAVARVNKLEEQAEHERYVQPLLGALVLAGFEDWAHVAGRARAGDTVALELLFRLGDRS